MATDDTNSRSRSPRRPGRPLSRASERAIYEAGLALLAERGIAGFTVDELAARARVGKATVYRRWSSKEALVGALVSETIAELPRPDTGNVRTDLVEYLRALVHLWRTPDPAIFRAVVAELGRNPALRQPFAEAVRARRAVTRGILQRAAARGEIREDFDFDVALDMYAGAPAYRLLVTGEPFPDDFCDEVVDVVLAGIAVR